MESFEKKIKDEVQRTMSVPDRMQRVEGNPYLLTRVQESLKQEAKKSAVSSPNFALVTLALCLLLVNSFVLLNAFSSTSTSEVSALNEHLFPSAEQDNWYEYLN